MKNAKPFLIAVTAVSIAFLLLGVGTLSVKADKPDSHKPVHATDMVLVKKVTLKGGRAAGSGGNKSTEAATGVLGTLLRKAAAKYAIVVGISDYPGTASDLEYGDDDADEVTRVLTSTYGFQAGNVTTLTDTTATRPAILKAIADVQLVADSDDEVVFFFSGHGMNGRADDGDMEKRDEAIVAHDGAQIVPIWDGELKAAFSGFKTRRIIFIFDSCLAGGMDDLQEPGRVVLMACGEQGYSYEGDQWQNGEFTYYLAQYGIGSGQANIHDYDGDHVLLESDQVTAEEAFDYAKANCKLDRPVIADSFQNDLLP
jgi:hypothetical protein